MRGKKYKSVLTLTAFIVSLALCMARPVIAQNSIGENEAIKKELKERNQELKEELQKSRDSIQQEGDRKDQLDKEIELIKEQIANSNQYILRLENEIHQHEDRTEQINQDVKKKVKILKESLYSIYVAGDASAIDIILQAKTFEDFLDKAELVRSVSDKISGLIDQLNEDLRQIEEDKHAIEAKRAEAEIEIQDLNNSQNELNVLLMQSEAALSDLQKSEQQVKDQIDENDEELKKIESEIQNYYEQQRIIAEREKRKKEEEERKRQEEQKNSQTKNISTNTSNNSANKEESTSSVGTGNYVWPVPGFYYISSGYYDTANRKSMHGAIDIAGAGIYGSKIVAADDGEVIFVNASGWGGGYGIYAIIDHGNGKSTLYAHMSGIEVQKGQKVKKGQTIGYVGSTGNSTGPHLHFETRLYGNKYNPMNEFKK